MIEILDELYKDNDFIVGRLYGTSMKPFLLPNKTKAIITKTDNINKYDVVLYKVNNTYILHRVIDIKDDVLYIRGDNTLAIEKINKNNIIGKLYAFYNEDKYIEVNDSLNKKYYLLSKLTYPVRLILRKI